MSLQGQVQSTVEKNTKAAESEVEDLNQLARTTLSGVKPNLLPPEPFPAGFDLSALATSRTSRPPPAAAGGIAPAVLRGGDTPVTDPDDTGGRIDLRAATQAVATPAGSKPPSRTLPPRKLGGPRSSVPAGPAAIGAQAASSATSNGIAPALRGGAMSITPFAIDAPVVPRTNELDELIASRAFAPGSQLGKQALQLVAALKRAPSWSWVGAAGLAIGLAIGGSGSGDDAATNATALASVTSTASASSGAPSLPLAATALPQIVAAPRGQPPRSTAALAHRRAPGTAAAPSERAGAATAQPPAAAVAPTGNPEERTLDTLLDQAIGGGVAVTAAPAPRARTAPDLPDLPARDAVAAVMSGLQQRIRFCAGDHSGVATASVVVKNDGRVSSARINGAPFSRTASGRCMESVIRGARFPRFAQPTFRMSYPFQL